MSPPTDPTIPTSLTFDFSPGPSNRIAPGDPNYDRIAPDGGARRSPTPSGRRAAASGPVRPGADDDSEAAARRGAPAGSVAIAESGADREGARQSVRPGDRPSLRAALPTKTRARNAISTAKSANDPRNDTLRAPRYRDCHGGPLSRAAPLRRGA